jgi:hypothetical protein
LSSDSLLLPMQAETSLPMRENAVEKTHISPGSLPLPRPAVAVPAAREQKRESTWVRKQTVRFFSLVEIAEEIQSVYFLVFVSKDLDTTKAVISRCCNMLFLPSHIPPLLTSEKKTLLRTAAATSDALNSFFCCCL